MLFSSIPTALGWRESRFRSVDLGCCNTSQLQAMVCILISLPSLSRLVTYDGLCRRENVQDVQMIRKLRRRQSCNFPRRVPNAVPQKRLPANCSVSRSTQLPRTGNCKFLSFCMVKSCVLYVIPKSQDRGNKTPQAELDDASANVSLFPMRKVVKDV